MKFTNSLAELGTLSAVGKSNLKLDELIKKNNEIKNISSSIGASQNELVKLNKQLVDIQSRILDNQNYQISLQQKQLLLNEQQLIIQKKQLAEQEIQTSIQKRNELDRLKQQELKKAIYSVNEEIVRINKIENNLTKYYEIVLLIKDISNNNIVPNEFENIADKEYAAKIYNSVEEVHQNSQNILTDEDKGDIKEIDALIGKINKSKSNLSNDELTNWEKRRKDIEAYIIKLEEEITYTTNSLKSEKNKNNTSWKFLIVSGLVSFILITFGMFELNIVSKIGIEIYAAFTGIALVLLFGSALVYFTTMNYEKYSSLIDKNQTEITRRKEHLKICDDRIREVQVAQSESKKGLKILIEQNSKLVNKYPFVKNRLFADVERYLN